MPHEFKKGKFMVKTAFELCNGFYIYMKQNGYTYCSVEKYQNSLQVKSLKTPTKFKALTPLEARTIRFALSSGHQVFPKLRFYSYKRTNDKTVNIYKIVD